MKKIIGKIFLYGFMALFLLSDAVLYRKYREQSRENAIIKKDIEEKLDLDRTFSENIVAGEKEILDLQLDMKKNEDELRNIEAEKVNDIYDTYYNMMLGRWNIVEEVFMEFTDTDEDRVKEKYIGKTFYLDDSKFIFDDTVIFKYPIKYNMIMVPKAQWEEYLEEMAVGVPLKESLDVFGSTGEYHASCTLSGFKQLSDKFDIERIYIVDDYNLILKAKGGAFLRAERLDHLDNWRSSYWRG